MLGYELSKIAGRLHRMPNVFKTTARTNTHATGRGGKASPALSGQYGIAQDWAKF